MKKLLLVFVFLCSQITFAGIIEDFFDGECTNLAQLRDAINPSLQEVDEVFYIKGTFTSPKDEQGAINLNAFGDDDCSESAGYFNRSWDGKRFRCSSGGVNNCYRRKGLYGAMTELVLELLRVERTFREFCIGSFAETNQEMYNQTHGDEEERILGTAIGRTVVAYFGRDQIKWARSTEHGYCIKLKKTAW